MKGYKVFNPDWTCRGFQYEVGKTFEVDCDPVVCMCGFHFCERPSDCFGYYGFDPHNKVAEVEALGKTVTEGNKTCTNKIKIIRQVSWEEVLKLVNTGENCTGLCNSGNRNSGNCNSGNRNSGNCNSGNRNSGNCNSGDWNSGDWNSGDWNSGDWNSGNRNSGNRNSGNCNSGNRNSGDWNKTNHSSGCFNTEEPKIFMFNKPSNWTFIDWINSEARNLLNMIPSEIVDWVYLEDMTDEEKEEHPESKTTGGYLKVFDKSKTVQMWWDGLTEYDKDTIKSLPNFDKDIFEKIVGVRI